MSTSNKGVCLLINGLQYAYIGLTYLVIYLAVFTLNVEMLICKKMTKNIKKIWPEI